MSTYFAGIDVGSRTCKGIIINAEEEVIVSAICKTGVESEENAHKVLQDMLKQAGIEKEVLKAIVGTGYGRNNVKFANKNITEITCHAKGAHFLFPEINGLIDIGGQDSKVIKLTDNGQVLDFAMNDKCAAGTGKFLEVMADTLEVSLDEMGLLAEKAEQKISLSSVCTVFAESEVITHIHQGVAKENIIAGLYDSIVNKVINQIERVNLTSPVAMTGGVAKNSGIINALETELGFDLQVAEDPQIIGALGAALLAKEDYINN